MQKKKDIYLCFYSYYGICFEFEKHCHLLLAEYLFSFLDLFAFFKQPSHPKLRGIKQDRGKMQLYCIKTYFANSSKSPDEVRNNASHPDGQMVSLCKTQIWCILRPQSEHSTNLNSETQDNRLKILFSVLGCDKNWTYSSGSSVSFFLFSNWSLLIDLKIKAV